MGILACAIYGTVTSNRFGFALEGSWCAFDRIYFDSLNAKIKEIVINPDERFIKS